jgi:hypothetical protein
MALGTVHHIKPGSSGSEAAGGVIQQKDIPDYL